MTSNQPCTQCGMQYQCICSLIPSLHTSLHILLLTHENEFSRSTNTGKLLMQTMPNVKASLWHRNKSVREIDERLIQEEWHTVVVFPHEHSVELGIYSRKPGKRKNQQMLFVVIDATWQEAKKIYRKSTWLKALPHIHLTPTSNSRYTLRRNQSSGHLCTCEVGIELLRAHHYEAEAEQLQNYFEYYLKAYQADKSGHKLAHN